MSQTRRSRLWMASAAVVLLSVTACANNDTAGTGEEEYSIGEGIMGNATPVTAGAPHEDVPGSITTIPFGVEYLRGDSDNAGEEGAGAATRVVIADEVGATYVVDLQIGSEGTSIEYLSAVEVASAWDRERSPSTERNGQVVIPGLDRFYLVDLRATQDQQLISEIEFPGAWSAATWLDDDSVVLADTEGNVVTTSVSGEEEARTEVAGSGGVDELVNSGNEIYTLNVPETMLHSINKDGDSLALRAGLAAARLDASEDLIAITDVVAGQVMVFGSNPLRQQQATPVPEGPWGLAVSDARPGVIWITFTASNTVQAFDVSSGQAMEVGRLNTGVDPRSVHETSDGGLHVGHADGTVQYIPAEQIPGTVPPMR